MIALLFYPGMPIIRWWTRSPFGHVAVLQGDTVYEAVSPRVSARLYRPGTWDADAHLVPLDGLTDAQVDAMRAFLVTTIGDPYDWSAIVLDILGGRLPKWIALRDTDRRRWDCSRLAAEALRAAGIALPGLDDLQCPVSPGALYTLLNNLLMQEIGHKNASTH